MTSAEGGVEHGELWEKLDEVPIEENPFFMGYEPYELYDPEGRYISVFFDNDDQEVLKAFGAGYSAKPIDTSLQATTE